MTIENVFILLLFLSPIIYYSLEYLGNKLRLKLNKKGE